jgi:hypothetical protein
MPRSSSPAGPSLRLRSRRLSEANGIAERTLFRAKAELKIAARKNGLRAGWTWPLRISRRSSAGTIAELYRALRRRLPSGRKGCQTEKEWQPSVNAVAGTWLARLEPVIYLAYT